MSLDVRVEILVNMCGLGGELGGGCGAGYWISRYRCLYGVHPM